MFKLKCLKLEYFNERFYSIVLNFITCFTYRGSSSKCAVVNLSCDTSLRNVLGDNRSYCGNLLQNLCCVPEEVQMVGFKDMLVNDV